MRAQVINGCVAWAKIQNYALLTNRNPPEKNDPRVRKKHNQSFTLCLSHQRTVSSSYPSPYLRPYPHTRRTSYRSGSYTSRNPRPGTSPSALKTEGQEGKAPLEAYHPRPSPCVKSSSYSHKTGDSKGLSAVEAVGAASVLEAMRAKSDGNLLT